MMLDLNHIRAAPVRQAPFPYFIVNDAISAAESAQVADAFPLVNRPGAVDVDETEFGTSFGAMLHDLGSERFRQLVGEKLEIDLADRDTVINVRAQTRLTDGNIHTDTPSKLVTVLLYFNRSGQAEDTGLRILNNGKDIDNYVEEIPSTLGTMVVFKVTPNCWHGHKPFAGKRHSLQLNYLSGVKTIGKHQLAHRLVGRMKRRLAHIFKPA